MEQDKVCRNSQINCIVSVNLWTIQTRTREPPPHLWDQRKLSSHASTKSCLVVLISDYGDRITVPAIPMGCKEGRVCGSEAEWKLGSSGGWGPPWMPPPPLQLSTRVMASRPGWFISMLSLEFRVDFHPGGSHRERERVGGGIFGSA